MAREVKRLSDRTVKTRKTPGYHHDGAGLYLQISPSGTKSWIYRFTLNGKTREMGLGGYPTFSLAEARERTQAQRKLVADRIDPIAARDAQRAQEAAKQANTLTFAQCAERYIAAHRSGWKNAKHADQWNNTLATYAAPIMGKMSVRDIDTPHIKRILEPIWMKKPETASRVRSRIETVLNWAVHNGYRDEGANPARWKGHLALSFPKRSEVRTVKNQPALPYRQIAEFMQELRLVPGTAARALEFAILNANRSGEVLTAKTKEIDFDTGIWTIPADRMKAGKEHRVPLSKRALEIAKVQVSDSAYLFPGRTKNEPLSQQAMLMVVRRLNTPTRWKASKTGAPIVPHGFRSTFRNWAAEQTHYPHEMCEIAMAHQQDDKTIAAYLREDMMQKRRRLMEDWARYCTTPREGGKVLAMKQRRVS